MESKHTNQQVFDVYGNERIDCISLQKFTTNFDILSSSMFDNINWTNMIIAGESVFDCINYNRTTPEKTSEFTVFFYNTLVDNILPKIKDVYNNISNIQNTKHFVVRDAHTITIHFSGAYTNIKFLTYAFNNIHEVLSLFDISCFQVCYNGETLLVSRDAVTAMNSRQVSYLLTHKYDDKYNEKILKCIRNSFEVSELPTVTDLTFYEKVPTTSFDKVLVKAKLHDSQKDYINAIKPFKMHGPLEHETLTRIEKHKELTIQTLCEEDLKNHTHDFVFGTIDEVLEKHCDCVIGPQFTVVNYDSSMKISHFTSDVKTVSDTKEIDITELITLIAAPCHKTKSFNTFKSKLSNYDMNVLLQQRDIHGRSLIVLAITYCRADIANHLILFGANILDKNNEGYNCLQLCLVNELISTFKTIMDCKSVNVMQACNESNNVHSLTTLQLAIIYGKCEQFDKLMLIMKPNKDTVVDLLHTSLLYRKYDIVKHIFNTYSVNYQTKISLFNYYLKLTPTNELVKYINVFKKKIVVKEDEDSESDSSDNNDLNDEELYSESDDSQHSDNQSSDSDSSDGEPDVESESDTEERILRSDYNFDVSLQLTNYIDMLVNSRFDDELMLRVQTIIDFGGSYFNPLYDFKTKEEHAQVKQPIFTLVAKLVDMDISTEYNKDQFKRGFILLNAMYNSGQIDINWFNHNLNTIYDLVSNAITKQKTLQKRYTEEKDALTHEIKKNSTKSDNVILNILKKEYSTIHTERLETNKVSAKACGKKIKAYTQMLDGIKQRQGVSYNKCTKQGWYTTDYVKKLSKQNEPENFTLGEMDVSSKIYFQQISDDSSDSELKISKLQQNKYFELFGNIYLGKVESLEDLVSQNSLSLLMTINDITIIDMAIRSNDEKVVFKLFSYLKLNMYNNDAEVSKLTSLLLSYKKYNVLELLFSRKMVNVIAYLFSTLPITVFDSELKNVVSYVIKLFDKHFDNNNFLLFIKSVHSSLPKQLHSVLLNDMFDQDQSIQDVVIQQSCNVQLLTYALEHLNNDYKTKYGVVPNILKYDVHRLLRLFVEEHNTNMESLQCFEYLVSKFTKQAFEEKLLHSAQHHMKHDFVKILLRHATSEDLSQFANGYQYDMINYDVKTTSDVMKKKVRQSTYPSLYHISSYEGNENVMNESEPYVECDDLGLNIMHYMCMSGQHGLLLKLMNKYGKDSKEQHVLVKMLLSENKLGYMPLDYGYMYYVSDNNIDDRIQMYNLVRKYKYGYIANKIPMYTQQETMSSIDKIVETITNDKLTFIPLYDN